MIEVIMVHYSILLLLAIQIAGLPDLVAQPRPMIIFNLKKCSFKQENENLKVEVDCFSTSRHARIGTTTLDLDLVLNQPRLTSMVFLDLNCTLISHIRGMSV